MLSLQTIAVRLRPSWLLAHPTGRWVVLGGGVGVLCGFAATVFELGTDLLGRLLLVHLAGLPALAVETHARHPGDLTALSPFLLLLVLGLGGLAAGLLIARGSAAARGGGTGVAVRAFHEERGAIPLRTTWTKLAASIITLGSGGSGGREGPISLVGAGCGSWFAQRLHLTVRDRRILLVAGIAGGIAAVFRAPLAASLFAVEVLYRGPELEADALIPGFIAAVVAYLAGTVGLDLLGPAIGHPGAIASTLFTLPGVAFHPGDWAQLAGYSLVAAACALMARWFMVAQAVATTRFDALPLPFWCRPAIGALATGGLALGIALAAWLVLSDQLGASLALSVVGSGYGVVHWIFAGTAGEHGRLAVAALLAVVAVGKATATALTVGSGGSAGLFGPSIVVGACTGAAVGLALVGTPIAPPVPACALIGMAGLLAATHRTPVAALLMVSEIAGSWLLLMPAMWVCGLAFLLVGRRSLIGGQVDALHDSPAHRSHRLADPLAQTTVADLLAANPRNWVEIPAGAELTTCRELMRTAAQDQFPVLRPGRMLAGMIDRADVAQAEGSDLPGGLVLADDLADGAGAALAPATSLAEALRRLHQQHLDELPVVDAGGCYLGMVTSGLLMEHYRARSEAEAATRQTTSA